jgi:hypothetical protein
MKLFISYRFFLFALTLLPLLILAQNPFSADGKSEIIQDSRVDLLVNKHILINQAIYTLDGFRIQLFSDSGSNSKTRAQAVYDELQAKFPGMGIYLTFKSPNYKVRIGDFRTRLDAQRFLNELSGDYPNAFIIADQINLPKTE